MILFAVQVRAGMAQAGWVFARAFTAPLYRLLRNPWLAGKIILFRPLKRAGDVLTFPKPQSFDWGYPMPPANAG